MKLLNNTLFSTLTGLTGIVSIEIIQKFEQWQEPIKFVGQSIIGLLTITYLSIKIVNSLKSRKNEP